MARSLLFDQTHKEKATNEYGEYRVNAAMNAGEYLMNIVYTVRCQSTIARVSCDRWCLEIGHSGSRSSPLHKSSASIAALTGMGLTSQKSARIRACSLR